MSKLNNLIAIAQPIPETQAETINGGSVWGQLLNLIKTITFDRRSQYYSLSVQRANGGLNDAQKQQFFSYRKQYGSPYENAVSLGRDPNTV